MNRRFLGILLLFFNSIPLWSQDTIWIGKDTIRIGALEWDMVKDVRGKKPIQYNIPDYYPDTLWLFQSFHPSKSLEQTSFGYLDSIGLFVPHGPTRYYYPDGSWLGFRNYSHGKLHGPAQDFYSDGHLLMKAFFEKDSLNGAYFRYYQNGFVEQVGFFVNGKVNGRFEEYYSNGIIREVSYWDHGVESGIDTFYYETGKIESIKPISLGKWNGTISYFHRNGLVAAQQVYENGKLWELGICQDSKGKPLNHGILSQGSGFFFGYNENGTVERKYWVKNGDIIRERKIKSSP